VLITVTLTGRALAMLGSRPRGTYRDRASNRKAPDKYKLVEIVDAFDHRYESMISAVWASEAQHRGRRKAIPNQTLSYATCA
jgi:hypothetical protein